MSQVISFLRSLLLDVGKTKSGMDRRTVSQVFVRSFTETLRRHREQCSAQRFVVGITAGMRQKFYYINMFADLLMDSAIGNFRNVRVGKYSVGPKLFD